MTDTKPNHPSEMYHVSPPRRGAVHRPLGWGSDCRALRHQTLGVMGGLARTLGWLGIVVLCALPAISHGSDASLFQQKFALVERFLTHSATAKRVAATNHQEARQRLDEALAKRDAAQRAHAAGQEKQALDLLDQALQLVSKLSRTTADPASQAWIDRAKYEDLSDSVSYFQETYRKYLKHADAGKRTTANQTLQEVTRLVSTATRQFEKKQFKEANNTLSRAQKMLIAGLKPLLGSRSLVYTLTFETPRQEYDYEVRRGESLEALVRMALSDKRKGTTTATVETFVAESRAHHKRAQRAVASGNVESAIRIQEEANTSLVRALRSLGIMIPL